MSQGRFRFGVLDLPDAPFDTLVERWRLIEDLAFDQLWLADQTADFRNQAGPWLDGWTALAAMALRTDQIRIGTLVSNPVLRHPVMLAKQATALDHLSNGRLELGIGTGIAPFDFAAVASAHWSPRERVDRYAEYLRIVDGLLTSSGELYSFDGRFYGPGETRLLPGPMQAPRPPITAAGQSPTVRRMAVERADCWNTHGPYGASFEEILALTGHQSDEMEEWCQAAGRDPRSLRRSLLLFEPLDLWGGEHDFEDTVTRFGQIGFNEFVVFWPGDDRRRDLEDLASRVIPRLTA